MLVGSSIVANAIMEDYKLLSRREEEAARMRAEAEKLVRAARGGAEQLEKDKAAFEKHKQTDEWAATAELKQVRTLAKLLSEERKNWKETISNERKTWKESWAKQNENLFRARQELANLKAANAALAKEKAAAEAAAGRVKEDEARTAKALEEAKKAGARFANALDEANADRTRLNQTVVSLQAEVQTREAKLADISARVTVAEERANEVVEARDALTSSFNQLEANREWMRSHGIAHIVQAIMDAPETATGIDLIKQRAHDAGFKAGYNRCIGHINILSKGGYTDERSGFRDVDTEALLEAAVASFYDMSLSSVEKLDECLDAADYVDRLRMLYADAEKEDTAGDGQDGVGTSGTK
ncbi:putative AH/BAR domain superfamily protein [Helianthus annuus]|nr:putative AH/BAR domain superfamily protein [Helianthus annuus]